MKQSRNLTRHVKELEALYESVLNENAKPNSFENEKGVQSDVQPKDSGPGAVEGVDKPVEHEGKSKKHDTKSKKTGDTVKESPQPENISKTEISNGTNINTNMSDKNIFDKLYSTIMEADDELGDSLDIELGDDMMGGEEESGGGDITVTLTQDQVDVLKDILSQVEGDEEDEIEDLDSDGGFDQENPFPEGVEAEHTSDGAQPGHDPSGLTGSNNKVPGHASKTSSGGASGDTAGQEDGGKPKPLADTTAKMTSASNHKVDGAVKGGNQGLLS